MSSCDKLELKGGYGEVCYVCDRVLSLPFIGLSKGGGLVKQGRATKKEVLGLTSHAYLAGNIDTILTQASD